MRSRSTLFCLIKSRLLKCNTMMLKNTVMSYFFRFLCLFYAFCLHFMKEVHLNFFELSTYFIPNKYLFSQNHSRAPFPRMTHQSPFSTCNFPLSSFLLWWKKWARKRQIPQKPSETGSPEPVSEGFFALLLIGGGNKLKPII